MDGAVQRAVQGAGMGTPGSVSQWIHELKTGERHAATRLWERYYCRLTEVARTKLDGMPRRSADEEDVAAAVFASFFRRMERGRFPELAQRDELWHLLLKIVGCKVVNYARDHFAAKRGGGRVLGESAAGRLRCGGSRGIVGQSSAAGITPVQLAAMRELFAQLDDELRQIIFLRLDGLNFREIARRVNRSEATIKRRLQLVHDRWEGELLA